MASSLHEEQQKSSKKKDKKDKKNKVKKSKDSKQKVQCCVQELPKEAAEVDTNGDIDHSNNVPEERKE